MSETAVGLLNCAFRSQGPSQTRSRLSALDVFKDGQSPGPVQCDQHKALMGEKADAYHIVKIRTWTIFLHYDSRTKIARQLPKYFLLGT